MERAGDILGIVALGWLSWQDFRTRRISWWLIPLLAAAFLLAGLQRTPVGEIGKAFALNLVFLFVQLLLVWAWIALRAKKLTNLINTQIGLGDVLFMCCVALAFSTVNFLLFYTLGMVATLFLVVIARFLRPKINNEIPLAGALALPLIALCSIRVIDPTIDFYSDEWLTQLLDRTLVLL
jgi:Flp pilus assembly protein protease CpaA